MNKELNALIRKTQKKVNREIHVKNTAENQRKKDRGCYECSLTSCRRCSDCHDAILRSALNF